MDHSYASAVPEPPHRSEAAAPSLIDVLEGIGRWRRTSRFGGQVRLANADPAKKLSLQAIDDAVPEFHPKSVRAPEIRATDLRGVELPAPLERAYIWVAALSRAITSGESAPRIRGVVRTAIGFIPQGRGVRLAAIFYVRPLALLQAAPMTMDVDGEEFPIVLRRPPQYIDSYATLGFPNGIATCDARLDGRWGVLTAAHVVAEDGDKFSVAAGDEITCSNGNVEPIKRTVLAADPIMDAALVDGEQPAEPYDTVRAFPFCGFLPVRVCLPAGYVDTYVTEIPLPEGVIRGEYGKRPTQPAELLITASGQHGWSGAMVRENTYGELGYGPVGGRPYGMFVGAAGLRTGAFGWVHLLRQLEMVWHLEIASE